MGQRTLTVYLAYFSQFVKQQMEYKADLVAALISHMISTAGGLLFVFLLLDGEIVSSLAGWSREEVIFIYGYSMMGMAIFTFVASNLYGFGDRYIIQGEFDRVLLRPLASLPQVLFESFHLESIGSLLVGLIVIVSLQSTLPSPFSFLDILWLIVSAFSGGVILLSVFIITSSVSFHFEDRVGINPPVFNLIQFSRYPLPIFHPIIQFLLSWVIPFGFVAFYPATHFFDREEFSFYCYLTPGLALLSLCLALLAWQFGVKRYQSTGS